MPEYEVALSFAGEDRTYVDQVALQLISLAFRDSAASHIGDLYIADRRRLRGGVGFESATQIEQ